MCKFSKYSMYKMKLVRLRFLWYIYVQKQCKTMHVANTENASLLYAVQIKTYISNYRRI